jgi:hypothetical protein
MPSKLNELPTRPHRWAAMNSRRAAMTVAIALVTIGSPLTAADASALQPGAQQVLPCGSALRSDCTSSVSSLPPSNLSNPSGCTSPESILCREPPRIVDGWPVATAPNYKLKPLSPPKSPPPFTPPPRVDINIAPGLPQGGLELSGPVTTNAFPEVQQGGWAEQIIQQNTNLSPIPSTLSGYAVSHAISAGQPLVNDTLPLPLPAAVSRLSC